MSLKHLFKSMPATLVPFCFKFRYGLLRRRLRNNAARPIPEEPTRPGVRTALHREATMNRLCYGGSFNPIHHGHLIVARAVAEARGFERVVLIPSAQPPHKPGRPDIAPAEDRLAMCRLAVESADTSDLFEVSDLELRRHGPSYTIDTARVLTEQGWGTIHWLIGGDTLPLLSSWHQPEALLRKIGFVIAARPGYPIDWDRVPPAWHVFRSNVVPAPLIDVSATDIRRRVAEGRSIDYLTPPAVVQYVRERGLYAGGAHQPLSR